MKRQLETLLKGQLMCYRLVNTFLNSVAWVNPICGSFMFQMMKKAFSGVKCKKKKIIIAVL